MLPLKNNRKIRPSSAEGRLQTHPMYITINNKHARAATADTNFASHYKKMDKAEISDDLKIDLDDIRMTQSDTIVASRRMTMDSVTKLTKIPLSTPEIRPKSKIENRLSISILQELGKKFQLSKSKPYLEIKLEDFKCILQHLLGSTSIGPEIEELFKKIDFNASGIITLDQFCTYIHLCHADFFPKLAEFVLPARGENLPHRESVCKLSENFNGTLITCSEQGMFSFWSPMLKLRKKKKIVGESSDRRTPKWITDFLLMTKYNKLMIGTGNREIRFFEISSFDPYCQISHFDSIPLRLEYSATGEDECIIIFGDMEGQINILTIKSVGECLRLWKKMPKHENFIASIPLKTALMNPNVKFQRWSVHNDWVQQVKYCPDIKQVISCSNDSSTALVIGCTVSSVVVEHQLKLAKEVRVMSKGNAAFSSDGPKKRAEQDQTIFRVYKGVKCFDFNKKKNLLITGGMDRLIRIWNPYIPGKPTDLLHGHSSPIFFVYYTEDDNWIFSMSSDKCVKVWHGTDFSCLYTLRPKSHRIRGELSSVYYSEISKTLAFTTNVMAALSLKTRFKPPSLFGVELILSHIDPVTNLKFNSVFNHIVTASEGSEVKVWDLLTGTFISQFCSAHGDFAISCMQFDNTQRRLITGGQDGKIRIWNYNTGLCLKELCRKQKSSYDDAKNKAEVCDLIFVEMNRRSRFVVSAGWDRRINIYEDNFNSTIPFVHHPTKHWDEDLKNGHREEILSLAQSPSHMLASASYDGEIIVWKMMSGHIFCHLQAPIPFGYQDYSLDGDLSIRKLLFLDYRSSKQCKAQLIASGPYANIHFWNIYNEGQLLAQFAACQKREANVTTMVLNPSNTILYTADSMGFIYAWDINDFCSLGEETFPPPMIGKWRGHTHTINDIVLIDEYEILITASSDCTVRMWTTKGIYIGVFGQSEKWNIHRPQTFQHPMIPYDVLIDPQSLPDHPIMSSSEDTLDEDILDKVALNEIHDGHPTVKEQVCPLDETMVAKLKAECFGVAEGIRLKHEKKKSEHASNLDQGIYKILSYHELNNIPDMGIPACLLRRKEDVFGTDFDYINE